MVASMSTEVPFLLRVGALEVLHAVPDDLRPFGPELRAAMSIAVEEAWRTLIETGSSSESDLEDARPFDKGEDAHYPVFPATQ